jgi:hypothetical protein
MAAIPRGFALALLSSCVLPWAASAANGVTGITIRTHRNLNSVAVQAIVSGDDDSSAVLRIFQRWQGAPAFDTGMVLVRRVGTRLHEGRILWLQPGRVVNYYVEARDAGGNFKSLLHATRSLMLAPPGSTGPVFHVNQRLGSDAYDGTSPEPVGGGRGPTRTIGAAIERLVASPDDGAGGGVIVAPGEYHEQVRLPAGKGPRFLAGDGTNRDSTIICGANEWVERGLWAPGKPLAWTYTQDSTWVTRFPGGLSGSSPGDSTQLVVVGWGEYLHRKTSIRAVLDDSTWTGVPSSTNEGELSGWYWQRDSLYVKRANGRSPAGVRIHTGYRDKLIEVFGRDWRISGLTLRFAGGTKDDKLHAANPDPGLHGQGIVGGLAGNASGLIVDGCRFHGLNSCAIYAVHGAAGGLADSVTVMNCIIDGLGVGRMGYGAGKNRAEEDVGVVRLLSRGANVHHNVFVGGHNGLQLGPGGDAGQRDSTWGSHAEIAYNTFTDIADDAIELDTSHAINVLVLGNTIVRAGHGISVAPIYTGPAFLIHNTIADYRTGGLKLGGGSTGWVQAIHNTITSSIVGAVAVNTAGSLAERVWFRNNILTAHAPGGWTIAGPGSGRASTCSFDYDLLDGTGTRAPLRWNGVDYSIDAMRQQLGWERNGLLAAPSFKDPGHEDWSTMPYSASSGRGARITGVNTSLDGPRYVGAPNLGAESLSPVLDAEPPARHEPRPIARALPNPARGSAMIEYALATPARVSVRLYDIAGRVAATLLDDAAQPPGVHRVPLAEGRLAPGIYLIDVHAGRERFRGRLVLVR